MASKKEVKGKEEEVELTVERILEINAGLHNISQNETCPRHLSFKLGMFKVATEVVVKEYQKQIDILSKEFRAYMKMDNTLTPPRKSLPFEKQDELKDKKDKLGEQKEIIKVKKFKLSDFEDVEGVQPSFYTLMNDLIEE